MPHRVVVKETMISLKEYEFAKEKEMNFILSVAQVTWKKSEFPQQKSTFPCVLLLRYKRPAGAR